MQKGNPWSAPLRYKPPFWKIKEAIKTTKSYLWSIPLSISNIRRFRNIESFVLFIGYDDKRDGVIGSLLCGHNNIAIGSEVNVLKLLRKNFSRRQIFSLLRQSSNHKMKHDLHTIGELSCSTIEELQQNPELLIELLKRVKVSIKVVHVVENPFKLITSKVNEKGDKSPEAIQKIIKLHLQDIDTVNMILNLYKGKENIEFITLRHEDILADAKSILFDLCEYMGVEANDAFLENTAAEIEPQPKQDNLEWPEGYIEDLTDQLKSYSFIKGYTYG